MELKQTIIILLYSLQHIITVTSHRTRKNKQTLQKLNLIFGFRNLHWQKFAHNYQCIGRFTVVLSTFVHFVKQGNQLCKVETG